MTQLQVKDVAFRELTRPEDEQSVLPLASDERRKKRSNKNRRRRMKADRCDEMLRTKTTTDSQSVFSVEETSSKLASSPPTTTLPASSTRLQCFKTKMCHFFLQDKCSRGEHCVFAHSTDELRVLPDLSKTKICMKWKTGQCVTDSALCSYAHGVDDLRCCSMLGSSCDGPAFKPLGTTSGGSLPSKQPHYGAVGTIWPHGAQHDPTAASLHRSRHSLLSSNASTDVCYPTCCGDSSTTTTSPSYPHTACAGSTTTTPSLTASSSLASGTLSEEDSSPHASSSPHNYYQHSSVCSFIAAPPTPLPGFQHHLAFAVEQSTSPQVVAVGEQPRYEGPPPAMNTSPLETSTHASLLCFPSTTDPTPLQFVTLQWLLRVVDTITPQELIRAMPARYEE